MLTLSLPRATPKQDWALSFGSSAAIALSVAAVLAALAAESPRAAMAAPGDISTYAGGGAGDGTAPLNAAVSPAGVAVDASGDVYFADSANCRVRKLTAGGVISTVAGTGVCGYGGDGGPATDARLNFPQSVAVSATGEPYIADTVNSGDQLLLAQEILRVLAGGIPLANIDMNKDGNINSGDQLLLAQQFGNCVV